MGTWGQILLRCLFVSLSLCLFVSHPVAAAEKTTGADFLRIEPSARAASMGGGFSALIEDVHAMYYNPAGLAMVGRSQLTATHTEWVAGLQNEYAAYAFPIGPFGWGFSLAYLHTEETERDAVGRPQGTFVIGDGSLSTGIGVRLTGRHYLGLSAKYLNRTLYHRSANGFAVDAGYQFRHQTAGGSLWKAGFVMRNLGPAMGFAYKEKLPTDFELAGSYQPTILLRRPLTFNLAIRSASFQKGIGVLAGTELAILSRLFLRAGYAYSSSSDEKLRVGFGLDLFELGRIDFAAVRIGQFNSSLLLSMTLQFSKKE